MPRYHVSLAYIDQGENRACLATTYQYANSEIEAYDSVESLVENHEWLARIVGVEDDPDWECHPIFDSGVNSVHVVGPVPETALGTQSMW